MCWSTMRRQVSGNSAVGNVVTVAGDHTERRRSKRYSVTAPVVVTWKGRNGRRKTAQGMTRDICLKGLFVATDTCPPVSSVVRCEVLLPELEGSQAPVARFVLQAVGRVVRTERDKVEGFGVRTRASVLADSVAPQELS